MDSSANATVSRSGSIKKNRQKKKTTSEQFIMLVREMDKYPEVTKGKPVFGANRLKLEATWSRLVDKLNSIGPPQRTLSEWKKMDSENRKKRQNCSQDDMDEARRLLALGKSKRSVAKTLGMNESTLRKRLAKKVVATSLGRSPTFTPKRETDLVKYLTVMELTYNGLTLKELMMLVFNFAETNEIEHKFNTKKKMAGSSWVKAFLQRHPEFLLRKPTIATNDSRVMDKDIPQVYSDLRGRINKRRSDTKSYLQESPRSSKRASLSSNAEHSGDPLILQLPSPKREPDFEESQEPPSSLTEEETPLFYPESPHFFAAALGAATSHVDQQPSETHIPQKNSPCENQSFNLLQQQIQNQTMLLDILKNMTNNIAVLLERQTTAAERQAAAAERQAAATEGIIQLFKDGICSEVIEKLNNK